MSTEHLPVDELFDEAARHPVGAERRAFLDEACGDDAELRQRVERLLHAAATSGSFLETPPFEAVHAPTRSAQATLAEQPGEVIGPYKLLEQIGEGGMGTVYLAEQTEPVARQVALKIIKPGMDSRQVIARFEAERQALAVMDHPNIAKVIDAGTTESGRPYFVMELVKGVPITQYCDAHKLSVRERLELFVPVCQAIQHAHQKGIIHRDIKPSNVMVACYDGRPVPKVIDFGIAKATEQRLTERTAFTQFGQIVGTFEYMSPEQSQLNQLDIDTRSDVYSLGVLLYELLTGQTPFDGERLRSAAFDDVLRIIREEDPPRPSSRISTSATLPEAATNRHIEPKRLSALVRGELDWIVMKALEKDRARRYATATALAADVEHYLNDEPVDACPPSSVYLIGKFTRRNRGWLSTAAVVLLTVLVGLTVSTVLIARERDAAEVSARREAVAAHQAEQRLDDARYNLYVAHTRLAREDWNDGQINRMVETLESHIPEQGERELRGWEWYYLMSLPRHNFATLSPDDGQIFEVKWSADQHYLAVAGDIIVVYDAVTNKQQFVIPAAKHFSWNPNSHELAVTSRDGKVSVWDADQGKEVRSISDADEFFQSRQCRMLWSPDASRIAVVVGLRLHIWPADGAGEAIKVEIDRRLAVARCLDWSPDGRYIAVGGNYPGWIEVWDVAERQPVLIEQWHGHEISDVAWSPDGRLLATASKNKLMTLHDTDDWTIVREFKGIDSNPRDLEWSPDSKHLAVAGTDGRVAVWDADAGSIMSYLRGHRGAILALDWSADGQQIATGSADRTVKVWQTFQPQQYDVVTGNRFGTWSHDGKRMAVYSFEPDRRVIVFSCDSQETVSEFSVSIARDIDFSPDGSRIAVAFVDGGVGVWKVDGAKQLWMAPNAHHPTDAYTEARCVAWSPDGRLLASCGTDRTVKLWDGTSGELLRTLREHEYSLGAVVWSPDGRRLVTTDWGCCVNIWNTRTWAIEHKLNRDPSFAHGANGHRPIAITRDSRRLAGGGASGVIYVWDVDSGQELLQLRGHTANIRSVAWTPDGSRLASGGEDGLIKIWDTTSGREMLSLRGHSEWISTVDWSPDGRQLVSSAAEVLLWDAAAAYEAYGPPNGTAPGPLDRHLGVTPQGGEVVAVVDVEAERDAQDNPATNDDAVASSANDAETDRTH